MNNFNEDLEAIDDLKNILYRLLEESDWNLHDEDVVSVNRIIDDYIVDYIQSSKLK